MREFCLIANRDKDLELKMTKLVMEYLSKQGIQVMLALESQERKDTFTDASSISPETEGIIVLGGDGTILQTAHDLKDRPLPILGINMGTLGFLAEIEQRSIEQALLNLVNKQYTIEERLMLKSNIFTSSGGDIIPIEDNLALNDIVITRSGFSRIISVSIYVNQEFVNNFRGDGVIISTPTGSTGYNLSAGGPIVTPEADVIVITPICPHTLNARSMIVRSTDTILVRVNESKKTQMEEAIVTIDGRNAYQLQAGNDIQITRAAEITRLICMKKHGFFRTLRSKLNNLD